MLVRDRPRLTRQALQTLVAHTSAPYTLTIIDDGSGRETREMLEFHARHSNNTALVRIANSRGITGMNRNLSVYWSEKYFGRGDWLCLVDNDVAFQPGWAERMTAALMEVETGGAGHRVYLLGGQRHPYHLPNETLCLASGDRIEVTDAVAGYCQLMRWEIWDRFGPLDALTPGVCQGEDFKFSRDIYTAGGKTGYLAPPAVIHTGFTRTDGAPAAGVETFTRIEGIVYE